MLQYDRSGSSGTFNGVAAGSKVSGTAIAIGRDYPRISNLSCVAVIDAETDGITITPQWEVSNDDSTYVAAMPSNAAANVILGTGTSGADTSHTVTIVAPDCVYGWQYARISFVVGVQTGTTNDTYDIGYCFRQLNGSERFR